MRKRSIKKGLFAAALALLLSLVAVETALRLLWRPTPPLGQLSFATAEGEPIADLAAAAERGYVVAVPATANPPRPRFQFAPGKTFYLCYADADRLARDWLDEQGRVLVRINGHGLRERPEIGPEKPAGEYRIVCIGDSFTFGWGVPEELGWVRLLEDELRRDGGNVRTVNCGAAGALCVDEYEAGLRHRFGAYGPDAVVVTIYLNDLIPSSGLFVQGPTPDTGLRTADLVLAALGRGPLHLDPAVDWVGLLLDLPREAGERSRLYGHDKPYEAMWSQGTPQRSLVAMRDWCIDRKVPILIVLWPFLQGLGPRRHYPFQRLHDEVAAFCRAQGLPFLDLLPALVGTPHEQLWVTPADMHANPLAQRLALPHLAAFVRQHTPL